MIRENEKLEDLQLSGLKIIQKDNGFKFGIDAVLLSDFSKDAKGIVVDFGTGTGIVPILLSEKSRAKKIYAVEIQEEMADMAKRSVDINGLTNKIEVVMADIKDFVQEMGQDFANCVVSNPPYFKDGGAIVNPDDSLAISRHEIKINLDELVSSASRILRSNGSFYMVHRPDRLVEIITAMKKYNLEPKVMRFIYPNIRKPANLLLIKGIKNAKPELRMMKPLHVYKENGDYSEEIYEIYGLLGIDSFGGDNNG